MARVLWINNERDCKITLSRFRVNWSIDDLRCKRQVLNKLDIKQIPRVFASMQIEGNLLSQNGELFVNNTENTEFIGHRSTHGRLSLLGTFCNLRACKNIYKSLSMGAKITSNVLFVGGISRLESWRRMNASMKTDAERFFGGEEKFSVSIEWQRKVCIHVC